MKPAAVELLNVWLSLRGMTVLEDLTWTLEQGGFLGIIGPNGAGKTALLKVILGLVEPDRGSVRVFGRPPAEARHLVGYVPQYARFDHGFPLSVMQVVLMSRLSGRRLFRRFDGQDRERARQALARVGMADLANRQIGKLSGGQIQRVLVARALAVDARLILLDEPTASLDSRIGSEFYELLAGLVGETTVILVSHDIGVLSKHVKSVACLNRRMHYHGDKAVTREVLEATYGCPIDFIVHEHTHRVLSAHDRSAGRESSGGGTGDGPLTS